MRPKTNRLLMLLIGAMLAGCASQTERSSSGGGATEAAPAPAQPKPEPKAEAPAYQPEREGVSYVDRPLDETPPPKPAPPPARKSEPVPDFPITKYELPQEEEVGDIGTQPDDSGTVQYEEERLAAGDRTVSEPTEYADDAEEVEDLGTQPDDSGTVQYEEDRLAAGDRTVSEPTEYADDAEEVEDLGTQPDESGTVSYPEEKRVAQADLVSQPQQYADEPAKPAPAPRMVTVNFEAEPLFNFDKSYVRADQRIALDQFVSSLKGVEYGSISVVGHADRIGSGAYNQKLSERRANAVKAYLMRQGVPAGKINAAGRGESDPTTGTSCDGKKGGALISCLQPDRRVDVSASATKREN